MDKKTGWGDQGQFSTQREYVDDLASRIGRYLSEQIKKGGEEAEKARKRLEMISLLLEEGVVIDEILGQSKIILNRITSGEPRSGEVENMVSEIRKKAEWVFEASKRLRNKEGEVHDKIRSALAAIDEVLGRNES